MRPLLPVLFLAACSPALSSLIRTTDEAAGANCPQGGVLFEFGLDDDESGTLEDSEVDGASYVCDGAQAEAGSDSLIRSEDEPSGDNCAWGGLALHHGTDDDGDGELDDDEIDGSDYVCDLRHCTGWVHDMGTGLRCWYTAPAINQSCNEVCADKGGFDSEGSTHTGNEAGMHFYPDKVDGTPWMSVELSSTDNNTNWGANGEPADGDFKHPAGFVHCVCNH